MTQQLFEILSVRCVLKSSSSNRNSDITTAEKAPNNKGALCQWTTESHLRAQSGKGSGAGKGEPLDGEYRRLQSEDPRKECGQY